MHQATFRTSLFWNACILIRDDSENNGVKVSAEKLLPEKHLTAPFQSIDIRLPLFPPVLLDTNANGIGVEVRRVRDEQ